MILQLKNFGYTFNIPLDIGQWCYSWHFREMFPIRSQKLNQSRLNGLLKVTDNLNGHKQLRVGNRYDCKPHAQKQRVTDFSCFIFLCVRKNIDIQQFVEYLGK